METEVEQFKRALVVNSAGFGVELQSEHIERLSSYYELLLKWNPKLHLVAPCSPEEFAVRHILESLTLLKHVPTNAHVADVGTGAGLPIIPCLLMRDDLHGVLIESTQRKAAFLKEAIRPIKSPARTQLIVARFEDVPCPDVDFITCRALDKFSELLPKLIAWAPPEVTYLFFAGESLLEQIRKLLPVRSVERIPQSEKRFLVTAGVHENQHC
ncbi:MAG TPA: 16S rRNA (guanine(527)-N(7))-methyltransferase RsmG [Pyrinomonadaceae bacterium]|nr:16S rRNA (guanine(527)-N(7))-methyltransferase RsmG [Pyrinomonadaceae bacterium]